MGWLLVLGPKECLVECATLCAKIEVMLIYIMLKVKNWPVPQTKLVLPFASFKVTSFLASILHQNTYVYCNLGLIF
jgi:hypothetical protein